MMFDPTTIPRRDWTVRPPTTQAEWQQMARDSLAMHAELARATEQRRADAEREANQKLVEEDEQLRHYGIARDVHGHLRYVRDGSPVIRPRRGAHGTGWQMPGWSRDGRL